jgi:hypothetical protein
MTSFRTKIMNTNHYTLKICWLECGQELLNILAPAVTLQTYIRKMSDFTLGRDTSYHDSLFRCFPQFLLKYARIISPIMPHPFQFIIRCRPIIGRRTVCH